MSGAAIELWRGCANAWECDHIGHLNTRYYMVRVELPSEATPQTVTRRVLIRAGEEVTADFKDMKAPLATVKK